MPKLAENNELGDGGTGMPFEVEGEEERRSGLGRVDDEDDDRDGAEKACCEKKSSQLMTSRSLSSVP